MNFGKVSFLCYIFGSFIHWLVIYTDIEFGIMAQGSREDCATRITKNFPGVLLLLLLQ